VATQVQVQVAAALRRQRADDDENAI